MKREFILLVSLLAVVACEKKGTDPVVPVGEKLPVRVAPVMTKVSEVSFENGDAIGLTLVRGGQNYVTNEKLTFDGTEFSGNLFWYAEGAESSTLSAYYPYAASVPTSFTVEADQTAGTSASDFIAGGKDGVLPSAYAVVVPFKHKLSRLVLNVTNNAGGSPVSISVGGVKLTASLAADFTATVDPTASAGSIKAFKKAEDSYALILPPQTASLVVSVEMPGGNILSQALAEATLAAGKQYSVSMIVNPEDLKVVLSGEIENWEDGGELGADETLVEKLNEGYITYYGQQYTVVKMQDGKWWMSQNLRYVPAGITVGDDLTSVTAGVFYPIVINAEQTAAEFSKDEDVITAKGYLYQAEVALGKQVGDLTTVAQAQALEGTQGICPKGWHVPTINDITGLVGKAVSPIVTNSEAPYYDGNNGSIALLNADGFNMEAFGAISIQDNTKTSGSFMGFSNSYKDHISSGMICGSSYATVTYNESGVEESGIKNLQFWGLMPMTNKASEADYTCNGTKVSYRIAAPVRCVRN